VLKRNSGKIVQLLSFLSLISLVLYSPFSAIGQIHTSELDEISIFTTWGLSSDKLKVMIINSADLSDYKVSLVKRAIESEKIYESNGVTYYEGWTGALSSFNSTKIQGFEIVQDSDDVDIIIELTDIRGLENAGFTQPLYNGKQINFVKTEIYDSNNLSFIELENIIRHEMGHALGLGHASTDWSMMFAEVYSVQKYITSCDIVGLKSLEGGDSFSKINCNLTI